MNRALILTLALALAPATTLMAEEATPAAPAQPEAAPAAAAPAATTQQGRVARATITTAISEREPVDEVTKVALDTQTVYLFTELRDMQGERVTHRWEYNGQVVSEVGFDVKSPRWRVWSSKSLQPVFAGKWTVHVVNSRGEVLTSREFHYSNE